MEKRPLGATGLNVSVLGLGTVKLGRNTGVRYPESFTIPNDDEAVGLLGAAHELGVNLIDTAPAYGVSEERLGRLLPGRRRDWVIVTKAGEEWRDGQSFFDFSPESIQASVMRSLRRLRTDWLDLVLLHSDGRDVEILERSGGLERLVDLKQAGHIRAVGMSTKTVAGGELAIDRGCDVVMVEFNPADTSQRPVLAAARMCGAGILVKKGLSSGHIGRFRSCENIDPAERAMRFILHEPGVSSLVIGTRSPSRLRKNTALVRKILGHE